MVTNKPSATEVSKVSPIAKDVVVRGGPMTAAEAVRRIMSRAGCDEDMARRALWAAERNGSIDLYRAGGQDMAAGVRRKPGHYYVVCGSGRQHVAHTRPKVGAECPQCPGHKIVGYTGGKGE